MSAAAPTPSQTVGPFFSFGLLWRDDLHDLRTAGTDGEPIRVEGHVLDGDGVAVSDALVEVWQADHAGRYAHPADHREAVHGPDAYVGFGRSGTDAEGRFRFETIKPGHVTSGDGQDQAPHLNLVVFARGLLDHLMTRLYFEDEPANATDPVLRSIAEARRATLLATRREESGECVYALDIRLQGPDETVFLEPCPR